MAAFASTKSFTFKYAEDVLQRASAGGQSTGDPLSTLVCQIGLSPFMLGKDKETRAETQRLAEALDHSSPERLLRKIPINKIVPVVEGLLAHLKLARLFLKELARERGRHDPRREEEATVVERIANCMSAVLASVHSQDDTSEGEHGRRVSKELGNRRRRRWRRLDPPRRKHSDNDAASTRSRSSTASFASLPLEQPSPRKPRKSCAANWKSVRLALTPKESRRHSGKVPTTRVISMQEFAGKRRTKELAHETAPSSARTLKDDSSIAGEVKETAAELRAAAVAMAPAGSGDGSRSIHALMVKHPLQAKVQQRALVALTSYIEKRANRRQQRSSDDRTTRGPAATATADGGPVASSAAAASEEDEDDREEHSAPLAVADPQLIVAVLDAMRRFKEQAALQRAGCACLAALADCSQDNMRALAAAGGMAAVADAMHGFPQDEAVQASGCAVLANPAICDDRVVRIPYDASVAAVLQAMGRAPMNQRVQGLGSLALANLVLKNDVCGERVLNGDGVGQIISAMRRLRGSPQVQAAGVWSLGALASTAGWLQEAVRNEGGLEEVGEAHRLFPDHPGVQRNTAFALEWISKRTDPDGGPAGGADGPAVESDGSCAVQ
ncbi:unnamed protein product [Phaeothamnion confervicola]